jgi:hypothetical protein
MLKAKDRKAVVAGDKFVKVYKDTKYEMEIVNVGEVVKYKVGKEVFKSPSAAAKFVKNNDVAVNGWKFWKMDR